MASKNTKKAAKAEVNSIPVMPVTLYFRWIKNPIRKVKGEEVKTTQISSLDEDGNKVMHFVDQLPKKIEGKVTVERLKGMSYNPEIIALFDFVGRTSVYDIQPVLVLTAKMDEPIEANWSSLSKTDSLITWMMNNATKLYLTSNERRLDSPFVDRNFTELCGELFNEDPTKVYGSTNKVKSAKSDIKDIKIIREAIDKQDYIQSPLHAFKQAALSIPGALEYLETYKKTKKLLKA